MLGKVLGIRGKRGHWVAARIQQLIKSKSLAAMKSSKSHSIPAIHRMRILMTVQEQNSWTRSPWCDEPGAHVSAERGNLTACSSLNRVTFILGFLGVYLNDVWPRVSKDPCSQEVWPVSSKHEAFQACQPLHRGARRWGVCIRKTSTGPREVYSLTQKKESVNKQMFMSMTVIALKWFRIQKI